MQFEEDLEMKQYKLLNYAVKKYNLKNHFIINIKSNKISNNIPNLIRSNCDVRFVDTATKKAFFAKVVEVLENKVLIRTNFQ